MAASLRTDLFLDYPAYCWLGEEVGNWQPSSKHLEVKQGRGDLKAKVQRCCV